MRTVRLLLLEEPPEDALVIAKETASRSLGSDLSMLGPVECVVEPDRVRGQWNADSILRRCVANYASEEYFVVSLTGKDLFVPSLNFVFGLASTEKGVAIVSWCRLRDAVGTFAARMAKEIVHEVGHLAGLGHCDDESCVMWFSNTLAETDRKGTRFCSMCETRLRGRGLF